MLVLTRKKDQSILIGDNIRITITGIGKENVRVGIEAPPEIPILRDNAKLDRPPKKPKQKPEH